MASATGIETLTIIGICGLTNIILFLSSTIRVFSHHKRNPVKTFSKSLLLIRILPAVCMISSLILNAIDWYHNYHSLVTGTALLAYSYHNEEATAVLVYHIAVLCVYILLLLRVYLAFEHSSSPVSPILLKFYVFVIIIAFCAMIIMSAVFYIYPSQLHDIMSILSIVLTVGDLILNATLLLLFINKTNKVINSGLYTNNIDDTASDNDVNLQSQELVQKEYLSHLVTKYTVLSVLTLLSSEWFDILVFYNANFATNTSQNLFIRLGYIARNIEATVDCLVICLLSKHYQNFYYCLCGKCHQCCFKCHKNM